MADRSAAVTMAVNAVEHLRYAARGFVRLECPRTHRHHRRRQNALCGNPGARLRMTGGLHRPGTDQDYGQRHRRDARHDQRQVAHNASSVASTSAP